MIKLLKVLSNIALIIIVVMSVIRIFFPEDFNQVENILIIISIIFFPCSLLVIYLIRKNKR